VTERHRSCKELQPILARVRKGEKITGISLFGCIGDKMSP